MVKNLFPTRLYVSTLSNKVARGRSLKSWNQDLLEEILKIEKADDKGRVWSDKNYWGGYTSYGSWDQLYRFSSSFEVLEKKIHAHVRRYCQHLNWEIDPKELKCNSMWVNIMPEGTTHSFHIHPLSIISGTYYVQVPPKSSGIQFEDPRHGFMMACPPRKASSPAEEQAHYTHQPKAGEVILFESWIRHQVPPNTAKSPRVSVSFNYNWEK